MAGGSATPTVLGESESPITFERMARFPTPGWQVPRAVHYAPDGQSVTFLQSDQGDARMALFSMDAKSGKVERLVRAEDLAPEPKKMSVEQELRRERQRKRIEGITDYIWAKDQPMMVLPAAGDVFVRQASGEIVRLTDTEEPEIDPQPCPTGEKVAYVRGSELYVVDVKTKKERALTKNAPKGVTRGQSDFIGQEELGEQHGFFWAPDCSRIAYLEVDESKVGEIPVMGYRGGEAQMMMMRYPLTGADNPDVKLGIVDVRSARTTWVTWPREIEAGGYLARPQWSHDGKALYLQALKRNQKELSLVHIDAATARASQLFGQGSFAWVDLVDMKLRKDGKTMVWTGVKDGHYHLELRSLDDGKLVRALTEGAWDVTEIAGIDEKTGRAFFVGTKDSPLERHLYAVKLDGTGTIERLTPEAGVHHVQLASDASSFVDVHSAIDRPPAAVVRSMNGAVTGKLPTSLDEDFEKLRIRPPELVTVESDGVTLHGALLRPRNLQPGRKYPAIVMVYGGPFVQTVKNHWRAKLLWQHLADRGFFVFQLDNRGSYGRGPAFETPIAGRLGEIELKDQLAGLSYLKTIPEVDGSRVGIYGHSYGGFLAGLAMLESPGSFALGIAGSPVTRWEYYDTGYTERYMGTPQENPDGYAKADLGPKAKNLEGRLFIIHALMDENVHFDNTAHLIDSLVAASKPFDLLVFPGERHGYRSPVARSYAMKRVVDYLVEHLGR